MKTIGQVLQQTRLKKGIEITDVTKITKIRENYILDLEADNYLKLPNATVTRGFIKNYGEFLGLSSNNLLAIFRRDFAENRQGQIVPRGMVEPVTKTSVWTPKNTVLTIITMLITMFGAYLFFQLKNLTGPPKLEVTIPKADFVTKESVIEVAGKTDPEAVLSVNDQPVVLDKGGLFYIKIKLNPENNKIEIKATKKNGKYTIITREINLTTTSSDQ